ncbi:MAG: type II toxin-antitoxin system RelE/ParE family toxin, partial [Proteobacteria bacterium]|nr:type II toxin-antitoxin system RelE/ParE family toxin [Pseudomonadota bacterium]
MLPVLWRTKARSSLALITGYIAERNPIAAQRLKGAIQGWTAKCQWWQNKKCDLLGIEYPSRKLMLITYNNVPSA